MEGAGLPLRAEKAMQAAFGQQAGGAEHPLLGRRILVTRTREQAGELAGRITALGGEAIEWSVIRTVPVPLETLSGALSEPEPYDWLVFTSVNGVRYFFEACTAYGLTPRSFANARIGAVGPKTAEGLAPYGLTAEVLPSEFIGDKLGEAMLEFVKPGERVLLPRARVAGAGLPRILRNAGLTVTDLPVYETVPGDDEGAGEVLRMLMEETLHAVTFTSSSTVTNFVELMRRHAGERVEDALRLVKAFCIGPITAQTVRSAGILIAAEAQEATINSLVDAIIAYFTTIEKGESQP